MRTLIFAAAVVGGVGFIIYQLGKFFLAINNGRSRLEQEAMNIRALLTKSRGTLIPLDIKELGLLSGSFDEEKTVTTGLVQGTLQSIYSEPLAHFGKMVLSGSKYTALVVQTLNTEITYLEYVNETHVLLNGRMYGVINSKDELMDQSKNLIADLRDGYTEQYIPIYINEEKKASIIAPGIATAISDRAFENFAIEDDPSQIDKALIMTFYMMLT